MMITTHLLGGILLGSILSSQLGMPELIIISALGAIFPDLDMFFEHRKTLHRPFQFVLMSLASLMIFPWLLNLSITFAVFTLSSAVHSFSDVLCNGKTMRPWKVKDDRAVYDHLRKKWIKPRRYFYDGSLIDLLFSLFLAILISLVHGINYWVIGIALLSLAYTLSRKKIDNQLSEYDRFSGFAKDLI